MSDSLDNLVFDDGEDFDTPFEEALSDARVSPWDDEIDPDLVDDDNWHIEDEEMRKRHEEFNNPALLLEEADLDLFVDQDSSKEQDAALSENDLIFHRSIVLQSLIQYREDLSTEDFYNGIVRAIDSELCQLEDLCKKNGGNPVVLRDVPMFAFDKKGNLSEEIIMHIQARKTEFGVQLFAPIDIQPEFNELEQADYDAILEMTLKRIEELGKEQ